jgi:heme/copper-type cytochrome/quinol oxidase subunit 1
VPRLSVWLIRTALGFLAIGMSVGAVVLAGTGLGHATWRAALVPVHAEFLLVGWTVQLVMGVAYWILPRNVVGAERGSPSLGWAGYLALNAGVMLAALGGALGSSGSWAAAGRALEALAAAVFIAQAWPRIRRSRVQA